MFLIRRPSPSTIERFLRASQELPLSHGPVGIVNETHTRNLDETVVTIGHGRADFERARQALMVWKQSHIGWMEIFPKKPPAVGSVVVTVLAKLGRPFSRWLQERFRRESSAAMKNA